MPNVILTSILVLLQLPDSLPPKPPPPPSAWLALIGAYASASETLYVYEDRGALTLLERPAAPAALAQVSESVFTFTSPRAYDERVIFRAGEIQLGRATLRRLAMGETTVGKVKREVRELVEEFPLYAKGVSVG